MVANEGLEQAAFFLPDPESLKETNNGIQKKNTCCLFYTLHFIKSRDKSPRHKYAPGLILSTIPRHHQKRNSVKKEAFAIAHLRETLNPVAHRILGIDAAANEIGCRPEVFAQAYRFLKVHAKKSDNEPILQEGIVLPKLGATYHVGEDFLDIIDGLRAIDESVKFLNLTHGDRIGHALALGIDAWDWYRSKNKVLFLPMHDILDNTVWMLSKIREFNLTGYENLYYELESTFSTLFYEIYENNFNANFIKQQYYRFDHNVFYGAWKLRGDNPELYSSGDFQEQTPFSFWERCHTNHFSSDKSTRKNRNAAFLYHCYHYNPCVKDTGNKQYELIITDDYIKATVDIQTAMQLYVRDKGISIETNPTSNYHIGTFKRYDKHPIINLYNLGLETDPEKINKCAQLSVSINTDDQGVFDTYLENEYSLMALALEKAKDVHGNKLYNSAMIYDWLERIRQMGLEQSFCANV